MTVICTRHEYTYAPAPEVQPGHRIVYTTQAGRGPGTLAIDWDTHKVVEPLKRSGDVWVLQCEREVFFGHHQHAGVPIANTALIRVGAEDGGAG